MAWYTRTDGHRRGIVVRRTIAGRGRGNVRRLWWSGGHIHGRPRLTIDIDLIVPASEMTEAEASLNELVKINLRLVGKDHPRTLSARDTLALAIRRKGRSSEAEELHREVLTSGQRILGEKHPVVLGFMANLALAVLDQGRNAEAAELFEKVWRIRQQVLGKGHSVTLCTAVNLTSASIQLGRHAEAENMCRELLEIAEPEPELGPEHPITLNSPVDTDLSATFEQAINGTSVDEQSFVIHSARGSGSAAFTAVDATVTADPANDFFAGELVSVSVTEAVESVLGPVQPHVWQFRAGVSGGTGLLSETAAGLGDGDSFRVALGDLDGDGDLDAFVANDGPNRVSLNDDGSWTDSGQELGLGTSFDVDLGDLDGDGDLDAYVSNAYRANGIWWNEGGQFRDSGQRFEYPLSFSSSLGDIDGMATSTFWVPVSPTIFS